MAPEICPTCGADVPEGARACPECGADEKTGWSETARYENLGIPDDSFDYGEYIKREFEDEESQKSRRKRVITITAILLLLLFVPGLYYLAAYVLGAFFPR
jgi:hypothetical protein